MRANTPITTSVRRKPMTRESSDELRVMTAADERSRRAGHLGRSLTSDLVTTYRRSHGSESRIGDNPDAFLSQ
jgi:hypothetical protein